MRVLIVGMGNVGTRLCAELAPLGPECYDKTDPFGPEGRYDFAFICVDTPLVHTENGYVLDDVAIHQAMDEVVADIYVIKSTVMPMTTEMITFSTRNHIVLSPEYYGTTQHGPKDTGFTVLGGDREDCIKVQQLLQGVYDASHRFVITDHRTAELAKLMENCWIATKVSFCDQFYDLAERYGVSYEELREIFVMDPRVSPSHTYVYRDRPYWSSHCLDKDVPATASMGAPLIDAVIAFNDARKQQCNI